jgi:large subunit ribosomal protein L4
MQVKMYNQLGKEIGTLEIPEKVFALSWVGDLVHQVSRSERANKRKSTAHAKGRSEVRGGGRKPWRQKGTGRARVGSIRSPLWRGGGVTHGPTKAKKYEGKINKKMRRKAVLTILSQKLRDKEILFLDSLKLGGKTKEGAKVIKNLSHIPGFEAIDLKSTTLVLLPEKDRVTQRALRNIKNIEVGEARNFSTLNALSHRFLVIPKESSKVLENTFVK